MVKVMSGLSKPFKAGFIISFSQESSSTCTPLEWDIYETECSSLECASSDASNPLDDTYMLSKPGRWEHVIPGVLGGSASRSLL